MSPMISVSEYIGFLGILLLAFGVVFELPLVLQFLVRIGIATPEFLRQKRKEMVLATFILAALITPPDVVTQLFLAIPILLLYELGIWLAVFTKR